MMYEVTILFGEEKWTSPKIESESVEAATIAAIECFMGEMDFSLLDMTIGDFAVKCEIKDMGCYHCLETFSNGKITEYVDNGKTAVCPYCGIDSVTSETSRKKLEQMCAEMFGAPIS